MFFKKYNLIAKSYNLLFILINNPEINDCQNTVSSYFTGIQNYRVGKLQEDFNWVIDWNQVDQCKIMCAYKSKL